MVLVLIPFLTVLQSVPGSPSSVASEAEGLLEVMRGQSGSRRSHEAAGKLKRLGHGALPVLAPCIRTDPNEQHRLACLRALGHDVLLSDAGRQILLEAMDDAYDRLVSDAMHMLSLHARDRPEVLRRLLTEWDRGPGFPGIVAYYIARFTVPEAIGREICPYVSKLNSGKDWDAIRLVQVSQIGSACRDTVWEAHAAARKQQMASVPDFHCWEYGRPISQGHDRLKVPGFAWTCARAEDDGERFLDILAPGRRRVGSLSLGRWECDERRPRFLTKVGEAICLESFVGNIGTEADCDEGWHIDCFSMRSSDRVPIFSEIVAETQRGMDVSSRGPTSVAWIADGAEPRLCVKDDDKVWSVSFKHRKPARLSHPEAACRAAEWQSLDVRRHP